MIIKGKRKKNQTLTNSRFRKKCHLLKCVQIDPFKSNSELFLSCSARIDLNYNTVTIQPI